MTTQPERREKHKTEQDDSTYGLRSGRGKTTKKKRDLLGAWRKGGVRVVSHATMKQENLGKTLGKEKGHTALKSGQGIVLFEKKRKAPI